MPVSGTSVMCNCCGTERMLDIMPHVGIKVIDGRHGVRHTAEVDSREMLERLSGTINGSAIVDFVRKIVYSGTSR